MKSILFIHQNFPAQFKHLAPALVSEGYRVYALVTQKPRKVKIAGVKVFEYRMVGTNTENLDPWLVDFESKIIRAKSLFAAACALKDRGFEPDAVIAHPGWGEALFVKNVWPACRLGVFCEWYYRPSGLDVGFDPEFTSRDPNDAGRIELKNLQFLLQEETVDQAICPTKWQASTYPERFQKKIDVIHDGIDTAAVVENSDVTYTLPDGTELTRADPCITFVNRTLEPYRGYHCFMRALPNLLSEHSTARVIIIGSTEGGYGARPPKDKSWKNIFWDEACRNLDESQISRVSFLGHVPYESYLRVLQLSTVHVYLTYPFVLSWSLLEAMSTGCAIVASDTNPVREVIRHNENGMLVDFFDSRALASSVLELLNNHTRRKNLSTNARDYVVSNYDLQNICLPQQLKWVQRLVSVGG